MYATSERQSILARYEALTAVGLTQLESARIAGAGINSIRRWQDRLQPLGAGVERCAVCGPPTKFTTLDGDAYCYVLGLYLGDGHMVDNGKTFVLRVYLDDSYPGIMSSCSTAMSALLPNKVHIAPKRGCSAVCSYSKHWACLFPQHGPGMKHLRSVALLPWQRDLVASDPRPFLRGLIHSDGCRALNRVTARGKCYEYPRYFFSNRSDQIRDMFVWACGLIGVQARQNNRYNVNVARRADVALLDTFIGPKA